MDRETLQAKLEKLEELERRIGYYEDREEIERLMFRSEVNHNQKNMHRWPMFYALERQDVSLEIADRGHCIGAESIRGIFESGYQIQINEGSYLMHWQTTPMIEISADRQTAHGVWVSPGAETVVNKEGVPVAVWNFIRYAADFCRENGEWKFLSYRIIMDSKSDFDKGWTKDFYRWCYMGKMPGATDEPPMWNRCYMPAGYEQHVIPTCPEPFDHHEGENWIFREEPEYAREKKGG